MEIKLKSKPTFILIFVLLPVMLYGQENYNIINVEQLSINQFQYGYNIEKCKKIFGEPQKYLEYDQSDGLGPEGRDKIITLEYDSLMIIYYEYNKNQYLDNINILGKKYLIKLSDVSIKIGDSLENLKNNFAKSYAQFTKQNPNINDGKEKLFFIYIKIKSNNILYYGSILIFIQNNCITKVAIRFDEGD